MTYNKLLEKVSPTSQWIQEYPLWNALREVIKLHKPMLWKNLGNDTDGYKCEICEGNSYPCPTIQTIEKELA